MTKHSAAGLALIVGSLAGLVTMATHPTGRDVIANAASGGHNVVAIGAHALAIVAQPVFLAGLLALTGFLARRGQWLAWLAFVAYATGAVAVLIAAVASGFIGPALAADLADADSALRDTIHSQMYFAHVINRAFATVFVIASCAAIALWSVVMWQTRAVSRVLAGWGMLSSALLISGVGVGHLKLDIHGVGAVVVAQGIWMIATGLKLRTSEVAIDHTNDHGSEDGSDRITPAATSS